jgi:hypothetical protein
MDNSFLSLIEPASSILILLPSKPYLDQVAAGLSLYLALQGKKETNISCSSPMLVEFNRLVGVNKVSSELGNKNLTIKFNDYPAESVERVSADIENGKFYLTIIPKPGMSSPKREQVEMSFSGVAADLVVLIGGANETHFPSLSSSDLAGVEIAHIGIRALSASSDRKISSFARPASSVSEIITTLINQTGLPLDNDIATNLLAGIEEGSREFKGTDVTAETFETVAQLLKAGGKRPLKETSPRGPLLAGNAPKNNLNLLAQKPGLPVQEEKKPASQEEDKPPKDWLEPKIYKGTSVS